MSNPSPENDPNAGLRKLEKELERDYRFKKFMREYPNWLMSTTGLVNFSRMSHMGQTANTRELRRFLTLVGKADYWKSPKI